MENVSVAFESGRRSSWCRVPSGSSTQLVRDAQREHGEQGSPAPELVGARYWGPGVFCDALRQALADGDVRRTSRSTYAPSEHDQHAKQ